MNYPLLQRSMCTLRRVLTHPQHLNCPAIENCTVKQTDLLRNKNFRALRKNNEQPNAGVSMPKQKLLITSLETVREEQTWQTAVEENEEAFEDSLLLIAP